MASLPVRSEKVRLQWAVCHQSCLDYDEASMSFPEFSTQVKFDITSRLFQTPDTALASVTT